MKKKSLITLLTFSSVISIALVACNNKQETAKTAFEVTFNLNEVSEPFDIHNETQNGYLNDDYTNIDAYSKASGDNSKPKALELSWSISDVELELTALRLNLYEKKGTETVNTISYLLDKDATSKSIDNLKLDQDYEWSITAVAGDKEVQSNESKFKTEEGIVRFINVDGLSNVRDCGGYTGLDGKRIKQGLLYRGEEFNKQNNGRAGSNTSDYHYDPSKASADNPLGQKISEAGIDTVTNELKIKTETDIRGYETFDWETRINYSPAECGGLVGELPDGRKDEQNDIVKIVEEVNYVICPVHTGRDKIYYDNYGKTACKNFFSMLADEENYLPLYFHCAQGKDRTGFLAYLFEALMGCSKEDMLRDYLLSNLSTTGTVSLSKLNNNYNYVDYFDGKEVSTESGAKYQANGETMAERAYNYLLSCGLSEQQLDTIRDTFLE